MPTEKKGIFITGTDTGVGKTWFTGRLCRALRERGINAGVWKPVQSGAVAGDPESDSDRLQAVSGVERPSTEICPYSFNAPLAPMVAARLEGIEIDIDFLISQADLLSADYDILLAEGAGGLAVPLLGDGLVVHLAVKLGFPLLIIARPGLGTVNHTLLSVDYARRHGLDVIGVILNAYAREPERVDSWCEIEQGTALADSLSTNPLLIEHYSGTPVLGQIPDSRSNGGEKMFEDYVQLERIIQFLDS